MPDQNGHDQNDHPDRPSHADQHGDPDQPSHLDRPSQPDRIVSPGSEISPDTHVGSSSGHAPHEAAEPSRPDPAALIAGNRVTRAEDMESRDPA